MSTLLLLLIGAFLGVTALIALEEKNGYKAEGFRQFVMGLFGVGVDASKAALEKAKEKLNKTEEPTEPLEDYVVVNTISTETSSSNEDWIKDSGVKVIHEDDNVMVSSTTEDKIDESANTAQ